MTIRVLAGVRTDGDARVCFPLHFGGFPPETQNYFCRESRSLSHCASALTYFSRGFLDNYNRAF